MDRTNSVESSDESDVDEIYNPFPTSNQNPGEMLDTWLAELDQITAATDSEKRPNSLGLNRLELEDSTDEDLNAILGELAALQLSLDQDLQNQTNVKPPPNPVVSAPAKRISNSSNNTLVPKTNGTRTESPDTDSGFSDSISVFSNGSSLSGSGSGSTGSIKAKTRHVTSIRINQTDEENKAEKIREALGKIQENITIVYVKAYCMDGSWKAVMVDGGMDCGRVLSIIAEKNHVPLNHKSCLVEHIPNLFIQRIYEDHESMVDNLSTWSQDSTNKIYFVEREDKYGIFNKAVSQYSTNVAEIFNQGLGVECILYLKAEGKKTWKKFPFVLRPSGVYYSPKGKIKTSKDLVCLTPIDANIQAYEGIGWRKKYKSPTDFGILLKPPQLQVKSPRHMKYLCAEDSQTLTFWMTGFRLAKHGNALWENYRNLREVNPNQLPIPATTAPVYMTHQPKLQENSRVNSLQSIEGFDAENPNGGTIKRKMPRIPLTHTTKNLVSDLMKPAQNHPRKVSLSDARIHSIVEDESFEFANLPPPPPELLDYDTCHEVTVTSQQPFYRSTPHLPTSNKLKDPPQEFLNGIAKVLEQKTEVAKKCAFENTTPSEILEKVDNVQTWVFQHYGNRKDKKQGPPPPPKPNTSTIYANFNEIRRNHVEPQHFASSQIKKAPPPPPPKRSHSTTLSQIYF